MPISSSNRRELFLLTLAALLLGGCASLNLGSGSEASYDPEAARAQYRSMMKNQAAGAVAPAAEKQPTSESRLFDGDRYQREGNLQAAVLAYFDAARLNPSDIAPRLRLAYLEIQVNPDRAERSFQKLLEEEPENPSIWHGLGLAKLAQSQLEEALDALQRAASLDPESAEIRSALGAVHDRLGQHEPAQEQLRQALDLEPESPLALNNLAMSHLLTDRWEEAEVLLRRASRADPRNQAILNNLGLAVGLQERYEEALEIFRQAGDEQSAQNNLGYVYYLNRDLQNAITSYEKALLKKGDHVPTVLRNLEMAQIALERETEVASD